MKLQTINKVEGKMMKQTITIILAMLFLAGMLACHPTPEGEVVTQKNTQQMLNDAKKGEALGSGESLSEQYEIPDRYTYSYENKDKTVTINVDARIVLPAVNKLPICRVTAADFTQEQVDALWTILIGDTEMETSPKGRTKQAIKSELDYYAEIMVDEKTVEDQSLMTWDEAVEYVKQLEQQYAVAPESEESQPCTGKLQVAFIFEDQAAQSGNIVATYMEIEAVEKGDAPYKKIFSIRNNNDLKKRVIMEWDNRGNPSSWINPSSWANMFFAYNRIRTDSGSINPQAAREAVQEILDLLGESFVIYNVLETEPVFNEEGMLLEASHIEVSCARVVNGVPVVNVGFASMASPNNAMNATWAYERFVFEVSGRGIDSIWWTSPLLIAETVNEDAKLKPFSEIAAIFEEMLFIKYAAENTMTWINIDHAELSLQRIAEQDSYTNGLLVPVWNFYSKESGESIMSINAINGTIIDPELGY
jgi:hypothetical protein